MQKLSFCFLVTIMVFSSQTVTLGQSRWFPESSFHGFHIVDIVEDQDSQIWVLGNQNSYINNLLVTNSAILMFDADDDKWVNVSMAEYDYPYSTEVMQINDLGLDRDGNPIVTLLGEVLRFDVVEQRWHRSDWKDSLDERIFNTIFTDSHSRTWITAKAHNVLSRDTINGTVFSRVGPPHEEIFLFGDALQRKHHKYSPTFGHLTNVAEDGNGDLWVAYMRIHPESQGGLYRYNPQRDSFDLFHVPNEAGVSYGAMVENLFIASDGSLIMTAHSGIGSDDILYPTRMIRYNPSNGVHENYLSDDLRHVSHFHFATVGSIEFVGFSSVLNPQIPFVIQDGKSIPINIQAIFPEWNPDNWFGTEAMYANEEYLWVGTRAGLLQLSLDEIFDVTVHIEEKVESPDQSVIYPNPISSGSFAHLVTEDNISSLKVKIFDMMGRICKTEMPDQNRVSTSGLVPGSYFVEVQSGNVSRTVLIVVQQ